MFPKDFRQCSPKPWTLLSSEVLQDGEKRQTPETLASAMETIAAVALVELRGVVWEQSGGRQIHDDAPEDVRQIAGRGLIEEFRRRGCDVLHRGVR